MRRNDGDEDENGDEKPRGPLKKKARPSKARSRFRECATHDCLRIHSFIRRLGSPSAATLLPVQHVGSKEVAFYTYTRIRAHAGTRTSVYRGYPAQIRRELSVYL